MTATPGSLLPGGIVLIDEPAACGINTFAANGEVLMSFNLRPGGDISQIIMGLTPHMALQLIARLNTHVGFYERAVAAGKGGAKFEELKP